ncbi:hypothetical protein ASPCAL13383 [Aspergillus calidoustus]|uniref:CFEM domain-containing protein n=1 Tax=Aspergillus calidoustus TaxID=454130 RepID=A0A0U4ZKY5_ASPCI|nr:hypothetical protein ASPCAL13383 [Aspergillus calidoustus]
MRLRNTVALLLTLGFAIAQEGPCERFQRLPQCADSCVSNYVGSDCPRTKGFVCDSEYGAIASCFEEQCPLEQYLYAMNITTGVCDIPPRSRKTTQIGVGAAFIAITTIVMGMRFLGRPPFSDSFGIDDAIGVLTYVTAMVDTILMVQAAREGWGTDMWSLSREQIIHLMKLFYIGIIFFYFSVAVSKLAILYFYLRIFTTPSFKRVTYAVIALCATWGLAVVFQSAFNCTPAWFYWTRFDGVSKGTCLSYTAFKIMPPINVALDVVVMLLPLPSLLKLNLPVAKKVRVISMFSVGILILVAGTLRLTHLYNSITTYNITYNGGELSYFGVIEAQVSVICTCMPAIATLLKRVMPQWFASRNGTRYGTFQETVSPRRATFRSSANATKPTSGIDEDDIHLITVLSDESHLQKPEKSASVRVSR